MQPNNSITIRLATFDDLPQVAEIYNEYIRTGNVTMDIDLKDADYYQHMLSKFSKRELLAVLIEGDDVLGWGVIKSYSDRPGYSVACETAVYLRSDQIGKGLGPKMKKYLIKQCQSLEYHHLVAKIFSENQASINYNLKFGYTIVGTQKEIGLLQGQWKDIVIMQLILGDQKC